MTYRGKIKNGVVVFEQAPPLQDGTIVRVEADAPSQVPRGSKQALLRWRTRWAGGLDELQRLLGQVQQMRDADLTSGPS